MTKDEEIESTLAMSIPCIIIELRLSPVGPVLTASHSKLMSDPELDNSVKDLINKAADAALKAALEVLKSDASYEGKMVNDPRGIEDDNFFDPRKVVTLDVE